MCMLAHEAVQSICHYIEAFFNLPPAKHNEGRWRRQPGRGPASSGEQGARRQRCARGQVRPRRAGAHAARGGRSPVAMAIGARGAGRTRPQRPDLAKMDPLENA